MNVVFQLLHIILNLLFCTSVVYYSEDPLTAHTFSDVTQLAFCDKVTDVFLPKEVNIK